ncbi:MULTISPECIES: YcxB family protein [Streptomyces]|uniref:Uncharacterized protein n=2 Tax=Streptomyces TaxID=1883 RepID=A0A2U9P1R5_STRAS|nr:YcxB family protein [Streptomyces actuosus]AWT43131.1 hypothetical protein DMT42_12910 [Streptomyces actuosus]MBM4824720.1 YcxB family protein [Streptomyces actuosus]
MVMDMGRDAVRDGVVELEFAYERQDMEQAFRLLLRKRGRAGLLYHPAVAACAVLIGVAVAVTNSPAHPLAVMGVLWGVVMFFSPRLSATQMLKAHQHHGLMRLTVGAEGVRQVTAHADLRTGWPNYGSYAESDTAFILRSPDKAGRCAIVLPKRAVRTPEDVDRLRAVLDGHLPRV